MSPNFSKLEIWISELAETNLGCELVQYIEKIQDHWNEDNWEKGGKLMNLSHYALVAFEQNVENRCEAKEASQHHVHIHAILEVLAHICE